MIVHSYGFEVEQPYISQCISKITYESSKNRMSKFHGHNDCGNWEIATTQKQGKPTSLQSIKEVLDSLFFSDQQLMNVNAPSQTTLTYESTKSCKSKLQIPFLWSASNYQFGGAGSHVHQSFDYFKFINESMSFDEYMEQFFKIYSLHSFMYFIDLIFMRFAKFPRHNYKTLYWFATPSIIGHLQADLQAFKDAYTINRKYERYHLFESPTFRDGSIEKLKLKKVELNVIPRTIEYRINENHYNIVSQYMSICESIHNDYVKSETYIDRKYISSKTNFIGKIKEVIKATSQNIDLADALASVTGLNLHSEISIGKILLRKKYDNMLDLVIDFIMQMKEKYCTDRADKNLLDVYKYLVYFETYNDMSGFVQSISNARFYWYLDKILNDKSFDVDLYFQGKYKCNGILIEPCNRSNTKPINASIKNL